MRQIDRTLVVGGRGLARVAALIRAAPNSRAALLFLVEWRAGLRVSEALALEVRDLSLASLPRDEESCGR